MASGTNLNAVEVDFMESLRLQFDLADEFQVLLLLSLVCFLKPQVVFVGACQLDEREDPLPISLRQSPRQNNNNNKKKIVTPIEKRMASCAIFTVKYVATLLTTTPKRAGGTPFGGTTRQR